MTTDTDALEERIARELFYTESPEERHRDGWLSAYPEDRYLYRDLAAAVLPIVADEVRKAKAEALRDAADSVHDNMATPYCRPCHREDADLLRTIADQIETGDQA